MGITGPLSCWFKDYLENRVHYVSIDQVSSSLLPVVSGVPQGSILGPLLFIVYVNDMTVPICYSSMYLFADDTKLVKSICSEVDQQHLQEDIQELRIWCQKWKMSLNISKCLAIRFSLHPRQSPSYQIRIMEVKSTTSHRDLGINVTNSFS